MSRNMRSRGGGRPRMGSGDYGMRGYDAGPAYSNRGGRGLLDGGYGGGGGYDLEPLLHQRSLQQQLSLRESQLALANSLLQQQQHPQPYLMDGPPGPPLGLRGGPGALGPVPMGMEPPPRMMMAKRRGGDMRPSDYRPDFKRPRNDFSPRPRDRYRSRDSDEGNRSSQSRRTQSSSAGRGFSGKARGSTDKYDPATPTSDDEEEKGRSDDPFHCHVCNVNCRDNEGFRRHMNSMRHNDRMMGMLAVHEEKTTQLASRMKAEKHLRHVEDEDKPTRGFCKICDMSLTVRYADHQAMTFHKKRVKQVTKGCGWCSVPAFKNFTEVLAHRETEEHKKNQEEHGDDDKKKKDTAEPHKKRPIRVEIPTELARYNPDTTYGQMCVVPVTGWFCKLCNKFYNTEAAAKDSHCKAEDHYVKYKRFVYTKLRAKAEAERDEEEKAEKAKEKVEEKGEKTEDDAEGQEAGKNGAVDKDDDDDDDNYLGKEDGDEQMEEGGGGEEEEAAILSGEFMDDDNMEDDAEGNLLRDTRDASDYQTADDTTISKEGEEEEASALSLMAGESGSEFLTSVGQGDSLDEENLEGTMGEVSQVGEGGQPSPKATRAAVNTSTPIQGTANKGRRGRKMDK